MNTKRITQFGLFLATALVLSYLESLLPVMVAVPGFKIGLANIVTMLFVYEYGIEITLCDTCTVSFDILLDGIVCDWKNRKDYRYLDFLREKGIWC